MLSDIIRRIALEQLMNKKLACKGIRNVCFFLSVLGFVSSPTLANAQTFVQARIDTGGDDLRGGNTAFITFVLLDGTVLPKRILSTGLGGNSRSTSRVTFPETVTVNQIRSIRISHDGSPRAGHPFDTYDNWNLIGLRIDLAADDSFRSLSPLYDSQRDSRFGLGGLIARFTGSLRQVDLSMRPIGSEPDFIITSIVGTPSGLDVTVRNVGLGEGLLTNVSCSAFGRVGTGPRLSRRLRVNQSTSVRVGFAPAGRITCSPTGVDISGNPEVVTANNNFSRVFP